MVHILPTTVLKQCTDGFFYCFSKWAYDVTGGFWWIAMLLGFCVALFVATYRYGTTRAFGFASFVGLIGSIFLATMKLMAWEFASAFILVGAIGIVMMIMSEK